jgi:hypothetical protein
MDPASSLPADARLGRQQLYDFYTQDREKVKTAIKEIVNKQGPEVTTEFGTKGYKSVVAGFITDTYGYCWKTHDFVPPNDCFELQKKDARRIYDIIYPDYENHAMIRLAVKITGDFGTGNGGDFLHSKHITAYLHRKLKPANAKRDGEIHPDLATNCGKDTHPKLHKLFKKIFEGKFLSPAEKEQKQAERKKQKETHEAYLKSPQYAHEQLIAKRKDTVEAYEKHRAGFCVKVTDAEVAGLLTQAEQLPMPASDRGQRIVNQLKAFVKTELDTKKTREFIKNPLPEYALTESGKDRLDMSYLAKESALHTFIGNLASIQTNKTKATELFKTLAEQETQLRKFNPNIVLIAPTPLEDPAPETSTGETDSADTTKLQSVNPKTATPEQTKPTLETSKSAEKAETKPQTSFWSWLCCIPNGVKNFFKWLFGI